METPVEEKLTFENETAKIKALNEMSSEPPLDIRKGGEEAINTWLNEQEELQKKIEEAEIVASEEEKQDESQLQPDETPSEPQEQEEQQKEKPQESPEPSEEESSPQEEDVVQFSFKRDELPDILKGYKDADEMVKQMAHARKYANDAEIKLKELATEKERLENVLREQQGKKPLPPQETKSPVETRMADDLSERLKKLQDLDDSDYVSAGEIKDVLNITANRIGDFEKKIDSLKNQTTEELSTIKKSSEEVARQKAEEKRREDVRRGIEELQQKYPELKTDKPVFGTNDCIENDVKLWADRVLSAKYGNETPTWQHRNAVINAYLSENPEIKAFCQNNAITPESIGSNAENIRKYATIANIDANMRGEEIDRKTGERRQRISPFNNQPVNHGSYVESYENLKHTLGISAEEQKKLLAEAEIRGQKAVTDALEKRATETPTLSDKGSASPENVEGKMPKDAALKFINEPDLMEKVEFQARKGDRTLFREYNKALKALGQEEELPDEFWPPEKK